MEDAQVGICRRLRSQGLDLPAIVITGGFATEDQVFKALALGEGQVVGVGLCRAAMAADMTGKKVGDAIKAGNVPPLFQPYGSTVEEVFGDLADLRALYGREANDFSTGAIGVFSYLNKSLSACGTLRCWTASSAWSIWTAATCWPESKEYSKSPAGLAGLLAAKE